MTHDPFSDILKLVSAETVVSGGFCAGGSWALRFPPPDKIKFCVIVKGNCWAWLDGEAPQLAQTGDVLLISARRGFTLAGDLEAEPVDVMSLASGIVNNTLQLGDGADFSQIGGHVQLDPVNGALLADVLPTWIHVRAAAPQASALQWILGQLVRESHGELPGAGLASSQLAQLMLIQVLRAHLDTSGPLAASWLRAVSDKRLAPALRLLHGDPGRAWQLEQLARASAMSRTTFALHFKSVAGVAPLTYLAEWRMRLAERALREENMPVAVLARSLGYTSESAFSNAFKRITGNAPKRYRIAAREAGL